MIAFVQCGATIDYTPEYDVAAGEIIQVGDLFGIAKHDIKANTLGSLAVEGVFDFPNAFNVAFAAGAKAFWDNGSIELTTTVANGAKEIGHAILANAANAPTVRVRLSQ